MRDPLTVALNRRAIIQALCRAKREGRDCVRLVP